MRTSITISPTKHPETVDLDFVLSHDGIYALADYPREARIVTTKVGAEAVTVIFYDDAMQPLNIGVHRATQFIQVEETMSVTFAPAS